MDFDTLKTMYDGASVSLLLVTRLVVIVTAFGALAGLALYAGGMLQYLDAETRRASHAMRNRVRGPITAKRFVVTNTSSSVS